MAFDNSLPSRNPIELMALRAQRESELANRAAASPDGRTNRLLSLLRGDMAADPDTGDQAHAQEASREDALNRAYTYELPAVKQQREEGQNYELKKILLPAQALADSKINEQLLSNQGAMDKQALANEGAVAAAQARSGAAGGNKLPSGLAERVAGAQTALGILKDLRTQFKPDYVGPVQGRMNLLRPNVPLISQDPGFANFSAKSATLANATIKAITGAQMSEPEAVRIMRQIPKESDSTEWWNAKADAMAENLVDTVQNIKDVSSPVSEQRLRQIAQEMGIRLQ